MTSLNPLRRFDDLLPTWAGFDRLRRRSFKTVAAARLRSGAYGEADALLARALIAFPNDADLLTMYALSANDRGLFAQALARWRRALDADPKRSLSWCGIAANLRGLGEHEEARTAIDRALEAFPRDPCVLAEAARIAGARGELEQALGYWSAAIGAGEPPHDWLFRRAETLFALRRLADAGEALDHLRKRAPDHIGLEDLVQALTRVKRQAEDHQSVPDPAPLADGETAISPDELFSRFESLGDNCEFGLVQRFNHTDPLGLFRFSWSTTDSLTTAFSCRLANYGVGNDLTLIVNETDGSYDCRSAAYPDFQYHTEVYPSHMDHDVLLRREVKKVDYLKARILNDLASAEKIFVRKGGSFAGAEALFRVLRGCGPITFLWVELADADHPAGSVERIADGFLRGYIARFAPYGYAPDIHMLSWAKLCCEALTLKDGEALGRRYVLARNTIYRMGLDWAITEKCVKRDVAEPTFPGMTTQALTLTSDTPRHDAIALTRYLDHDVEPRSSIVFSVWIWIPDDFKGSFIDVYVANVDGCFVSMADLQQRCRWQKVWTSARMPKDQTKAAIALRITGLSGDSIFIGGWCFESGSIPTHWDLPSPSTPLRL